MKALALVPVAIAAMMAFNISTASSQAACGKEYQVCMDSCASRSTKQMQDTCFQNCEGQNTFCAEKVYGKRPFNGAAPAANAEAKGPARDALAKTDKGEEAAAPAQGEANAAEPLAEERKPEPAAKAPQKNTQKGPQRAPAKH